MQNEQEHRPVWRRFLLFIENTVKETIAFPKTNKYFSEMGKIAKKLEDESTKEGIRASLKKRDETFQSLTTSKERILFFYRYFNREDGAASAYAMTYLAENSDLFRKDSLVSLTNYFEGTRENGFERQLRMLKPSKQDSESDDAGANNPYESLIEWADGEPISDQYKLQCLIVAACSSSSEDEQWPYTFDVLEKPMKANNN